jgi:hypothetical protein
MLKEDVLYVANIFNELWFTVGNMHNVYGYNVGTGDSKAMTDGIYQRVK